MTSERYLTGPSRQKQMGYKTSFVDNNGNEINENELNNEYEIYDNGQENNTTPYYLIKKKKAFFTRSVKKYFINDFGRSSSLIKKWLNDENVTAIRLEKLKDKDKEFQRIVFEELYQSVLCNMYENNKLCETLLLSDFVIELVGERLCIYYNGKIVQKSNTINSLQRKILQPSVLKKIILDVSRYPRVANLQNIIEILDFVFSNREIIGYYVACIKNQYIVKDEADMRINVGFNMNYYTLLCNVIYFVYSYISNLIEENKVHYSFEEFGWCFDLLDNIKPRRQLLRPDMVIECYDSTSDLPIATTLHNITTSIKIEDAENQKNEVNIITRNYTTQQNNVHIVSNRRFNNTRHSPTFGRPGKSILTRKKSNNKTLSLERSSSKREKSVSVKRSSSQNGSFGKKTKKHIQFLDVTDVQILP